jgi:hypothetical protein
MAPRIPTIFADFFMDSNVIKGDRRNAKNNFPIIACRRWLGVGGAAS